MSGLSPHDPDEGFHTSRQAPQARLWCAVLGTAVLDLFADSTGTNARTVHNDRDAALAFLTSAAGDWARHRRFVCSLAGQDPDKLREGVIAILEGHRDPHFHDAGEDVPEGVVAARVMWAKQTNRPPPDSQRRIVTKTKEPPRPRNEASPYRGLHPSETVIKYAADVAIITAHLDAPKRAQAVVDALKGQIGDCKVRGLLTAAVKAGLLIKDENRTYRLVPKLAVAASTVQVR